MNKFWKSKLYEINYSCVTPIAKISFVNCASSRKAKKVLLLDIVFQPLNSLYNPQLLYRVAGIDSRFCQICTNDVVVIVKTYVLNFGKIKLFYYFW